MCMWLQAAFHFIFSMAHLVLMLISIFDWKRKRFFFQNGFSHLDTMQFPLRLNERFIVIGVR